jgi:hypothetical protein
VTEPREDRGRAARLQRAYPRALLQAGEEVLAKVSRPSHTFEPGEVADPVTFPERTFELLLRSALAGARGRERVVWSHRGSEVLVHLDRTRVRVLDGYVLVAIVLETAQTGVQELTVPFAVGTEERLAGMVAVTERRPRGHRALGETWGEGVIATAWRAVLEVASVIAALRGSDGNDHPLRAGAIVAAPGEVAVVPQAKHAYETTPVPEIERS